MTKRLRYGFMFISASALAATAAYALPKNHVWRIYWYDAAMTQEAGEKEIMCSGTVYRWGVETPYYMEIANEPC